MAPRKKNLNKRNTVKVPYAVLYTRETAEGRPKTAGQEAALEPEPGGGRLDAGKSVPAFAKKK
jgi:hypothetical protein